MWATQKNLIPFFSNIEDSYKYSQSSHVKVEMICPSCGNKKNHSIGKLYHYGFSCGVCSPSVSYGERFMYSFLKAIGLNPTFQLTKTKMAWCDKYRYDFYFEIDEEEYIIETHGKQHYENSLRGRTLEEEQENDRLKKELALNNGIKEDNYIVIDCRKSEFGFIKKMVIKSVLCDNININDYTSIFKIVKDGMCKNYYYYVCESYEKNGLDFTMVDFNITEKEIMVILNKIKRLKRRDYEDGDANKILKNSYIYTLFNTINNETTTYVSVPSIVKEHSGFSSKYILKLFGKSENNQIKYKDFEISRVAKEVVV